MVNQSIDFLDKKEIIRYLVFFLIVLVGGAITKDAFVILITIVLIANILMNRLFESIELWFIWFFSFGFYTGQGFINIDLISKYIAKPSILLLLIFIYFFARIPVKVRSTRFILLWTVFLSLSLLSLLVHSKSPFVIITISSFFMIYLLIRANGITKIHCRKLLNLLVTVAIVQTLTSLLQVGQLIPPPSKMMDDGSGGQFEWIAGLDDVSCGTFGPVAAHVVSWYASLTALFCILVWTRCKKVKYLVVAIFAVLQFATVDSKTIMAVMLLMMLYLLYYLNRYQLHFKLNTKKMFSIVIYGAFIGFVLFQCWNYYYKYQFEAGGVSSRASFNDVYKNEIEKSQGVVIDNIADWGKIQGFRYVFNDFVSEDPFEVLLGYSLLGYSYNGKMSMIERKDTPIMQLNNFTKSRSSLIGHFAQSGVLGFILLIMTVILWSRHNKVTKRINEIDLVANSLLAIFLPFTLLAAFIYTISLSSITVISFAAMIAILKRYSELPFKSAEIFDITEENNSYNPEHQLNE